VCLGGEHKIVKVQYQIGRIGKQQEQIFESFRQNERIHSIFVLLGAYIVDGGIAASDLGVLLQGFQSLFAHLQVVVVAGGLVQEVGGFNELGTQVVLAPVYLK
jgi:hypothetical protein